MGSNYEHVQEILESFKEQLAEDDQDWPPKVQRALAFIIAHLFDPRLTVAWMKKECRINGHNFSSRFRYFLGKSPKQYMLYHRMEAAKLLLANPNLQDISISAIAYEIGFSNPASFSRLFKRKTGKSPNRWRKIQRRS